VALAVFLCGHQYLCAQEYQLGPDDVVKISVYREDELERIVRITADGSFSFPLLGKVKVEGMTVSELEQALADKLRGYIKGPQVSVFIMEYSSITVTGQVMRPGSYPLKGGLRVFEAISLAEGFAKLADQHKVKVLRREEGKEKIITVNVAAISNKGKMAEDILLKRGDIVFVPESLF